MEFFNAGYEEPGLPDGGSFLGASILTACESREVGDGSPTGALIDCAFPSLARGT